MKARNAALESTTWILAQRLEEPHGEYLQLRYALKGMASHFYEVLALQENPRVTK
ncbi:MAG: hypothetical protein R2864_10520 [Syntrophotaleaceae bacterium]